MKRRPDTRFFGDIGLCFLTAILFFLSFPNVFFVTGLPFAAFFVLSPITILIERITARESLVYGMISGILSYGLFNFWLLNFHPLALVTVLFFSGISFSLLFFIMKMVRHHAPCGGWFQIALLWTTYEWFRTLGFLGYPYGILAYAAAPLPFITSSARFLGIWPISLFMASFGSFIGYSIRAISNKTISFKKTISACIVFSLFLTYTIISWLLPFEKPKGELTVALIQRNKNPRNHSIGDYANSVAVQIRLSREAEKYSPDIIIWPETAVVPPIVWNKNHSENPEIRAIIRDFEIWAKHLENCVLITGNGQKTQGPGNTVIETNSALLFDQSIITGSYAKIKLVPFFEYFPFPQFQTLFQFFERNGSFWQPGTSFLPLEFKKARLAVPICFEDTFQDHVRTLVNAGATLIAVLSDDAWAQSEICERQHLAISTLRAVETGRTVVRSTNSGITAIISPRGILTTSLAHGIEGYLVGTAQLYDHKTMYSQYGDLAAIAIASSTFLLLLIGISRKLPRFPVFWHG